MQCVSRLLRANPLSSSLRNCRPVFSTPLVYPTKACNERLSKRFSATPTHFKFVVPKRKQQVKMPSDMTTFKGKPFDRASLESVMKVCACILSRKLCAASSHIDHCSADSSTRPPSTSTAVSLVSTTMARPVPPSQTTSSTYGESTLC